MIDRYADKRISEIWGTANKFKMWQTTEIAALRARHLMGLMSKEELDNLVEVLEKNPIDVAWCEEREKETRHDLNAFLDERLRYIPAELQQHFHAGLTSYDTEEPAFAIMLRESTQVVEDELQAFLLTLTQKGDDYRRTIMIGRTHGQEAELQSFGKRLKGYAADMRVNREVLGSAKEHLRFSKLSGAIGNSNFELEENALPFLQLQPHYGATQIMPRERYTPLANALTQIVGTLQKIALGIRLNSRSGLPLMQEPFGKKQKGSSAMPHKKNPITTEQIEGMWRMALSYQLMLTQNIPTWEERAIEQSCVERIAWPDLFHITVHSLKKMFFVIEGLVVYANNMAQEVENSRGLYASNQAKELLKKLGVSVGLGAEEAYRIVQLAAFNIHEGVSDAGENYLGTLEYIISSSALEVSPQLEADEATVIRWNAILRQIFESSEASVQWKDLFIHEATFKNENVLFHYV